MNIGRKSVRNQLESDKNEQCNLKRLLKAVQRECAIADKKTTASLNEFKMNQQEKRHQDEVTALRQRLKRAEENREALRQDCIWKCDEVKRLKSLLSQRQQDQCRQHKMRKLQTQSNQSNTSTIRRLLDCSDSTGNIETELEDDDQGLEDKNQSIIPITTQSTSESNHLLSEHVFMIDGEQIKSRQPQSWNSESRNLNQILRRVIEKERLSNSRLSAESEEETDTAFESEIDTIESDENCSDSDYNPESDWGFVPEIFASSNGNRNNDRNQSQVPITTKSNIESKPTINDQSNIVDDDETISVNSNSLNDVVDATGSVGNGKRAQSLSSRRRPRITEDQRRIYQIARSSRKRGPGRPRVSEDQRRRHQCPRCSYSTTTKSNLTTHIRIHTGEKPFQCTYCEKAFPTTSSFYDHTRRHHPMERPHKCTYPMCDKAFVTKRELNQHQKSHRSGKRKPFQCTICSKRLSSKWSLKRHERIHSGEKPYQCGYCGKAHRCESNLTVHVRRHHTDEKAHE